MQRMLSYFHMLYTAVLEKKNSGQRSEKPGGKLSRQLDLRWDLLSSSQLIEV